MKNDLRFYKNIWTIRFTDKDGKVLYEDSGPNNLTTSGQEWIMISAFRKGNASDKLFIRFANQTLTHVDTLASISSEPSGNGYVAQELTRDITGFPSISTYETNTVLVSKTVSVTASGGNIGPVNVAFLATSDGVVIPDSSGELIAFKEFPVTQTILSGNTGSVYMQITLA